MPFSKSLQENKGASNIFRLKKLYYAPQSPSIMFLIESTFLLFIVIYNFFALTYGSLPYAVYNY